MTKRIGPLDRLDEVLPSHLEAIVSRETPIPSIAIEASRQAENHPDLVRADIGQIRGFDADLEVLYGPPVGLERLREIVAETWNRAFRLAETECGALAAANVCVCSGAAEGLSLALACFAADGVVAVPRAHWENYANATSLARGVTVPVDFFAPDGRLALDALARGITAAGARVLLANFPSNPTGATLDAKEAEELAAFAREHDLIVIADEVYARLRYDDVAPVTLLAHAPERVIAISSASKEYLLPGARVGLCLSARAALTDRVLRKLVRANTASPNVLGQRLLLQRVETDLEDLRAGRPPRLLSGVIAEMRRRRDALLAVLERHGLRIVGRGGRPPQGSIFLMAEPPVWWPGGAEEFAAHALAAGRFSVVPGASFGMPAAVRFSYGGITPEMAARLDEHLSAMRRDACRLS